MYVLWGEGDYPGSRQVLHHGPTNLCSQRLDNRGFKNNVSLKIYPWQIYQSTLWWYATFLVYQESKNNMYIYPCTMSI